MDRRPECHGTTSASISRKRTSSTSATRAAARLWVANEPEAIAVWRPARSRRVTLRGHQPLRPPAPVGDSAAGRPRCGSTLGTPGTRRLAQPREDRGRERQAGGARSPAPACAGAERDPAPRSARARPAPRPGQGLETQQKNRLFATLRRTPRTTAARSRTRRRLERSATRSPTTSPATRSSKAANRLLRSIPLGAVKAPVPPSGRAGLVVRRATRRRPASRRGRRTGKCRGKRPRDGPAPPRRVVDMAARARSAMGSTTGNLWVATAAAKVILMAVARRLLTIANATCPPAIPSSPPRQAGLRAPGFPQLHLVDGQIGEGNA